MGGPRNLYMFGSYLVSLFWLLLSIINTINTPFRGAPHGFNGLRAKNVGGGLEQFGVLRL